MADAFAALGILLPLFPNTINQSGARPVEQWRARQLRMLENAVEEAMAAWERSKQPARRVRKKAGRAAGAGEAGLDQAIELTETQIETQVGDVRFLAEAGAALADIRKLYGLDASKGAGAPELEVEALVVQWGDDGEAASRY
ncbi:MAG TPA: hypothetical protein VJ718_02005 [Candidatus Binataceae bacterium]|nr:hypothetical protein [Candidatus Binataceae bacterium]